MALHTQSIRNRSARTDGAYRILVEATWPLDLSEQRAALDRWMPGIAPSPWLETRFGRDPVRWGTFRNRYRRQLRAKKRRGLLHEIAEVARRRDVVLLHGSDDPVHNPAALILEMLMSEYELGRWGLPQS
ncbi:MAG: DUF488 domain-containing protein [Planctomycetota bacterium]